MKMLIDTFVNAVFLYDDKMVLTYNFHESTETITFGELQDVLPNGFRGSDMDLASGPETCLIARSGVFSLKKICFCFKRSAACRDDKIGAKGENLHLSRTGYALEV